MNLWVGQSHVFNDDSDGIGHSSKFFVNLVVIATCYGTTVINHMDSVKCMKGAIGMQATTYADFRKDPKKYMDKATGDFEPITITRKNQQNAVLISAEEYNNMIENRYILDNPANREWLQTALEQAKRGQD